MCGAGGLAAAELLKGSLRREEVGAPRALGRLGVRLSVWAQAAAELVALLLGCFSLL